MERRVRLVFVADFIDRLLPAGTTVETVGEVINDTGDVADVLVGVDDPGRHNQQHRTILPYGLGEEAEIRGRQLARVPEEDLERGGAQEADTDA
jgi:hypothetical protein